ncbi:VWA domain-containing protein [bacterium]|nr:VWA domain-containing protein [bacterium]
MFEQPFYTGIALLLPLSILFFVWRSRERERSLRLIGDEMLLARLTLASERQRRWKAAFWLVTVAALIIALARPVWGIEEDVLQVRGLSLVFVLDVSASMDAQDVVPSRLERAKLAARQIIEARSGDAFAIVLFAGGAFVQLPLTSDVEAALTFLNAATSRSITQQGTALAAALELALRSFDERLASQGAIITMSDGEDHTGDPLPAAQEAALRGIPIHTLGYGDSENGAPIPIEGALGEAERYKTDRFGNLVITRLEPETLRLVSDVTGGTYQRAGESGIEVINLLNILAAMPGGPLGERTQTRAVGHFPLFVGLALMALTADILLNERGREHVRP